jgi:hypothetical protein
MARGTITYSDSPVSLKTTISMLPFFIFYIWVSASLFLYIFLPNLSDFHRRPKPVPQRRRPKTCTFPNPFNGAQH